MIELENGAEVMLSTFWHPAGETQAQGIVLAKQRRIQHTVSGPEEHQEFVVWRVYNDPGETTWHTLSGNYFPSTPHNESVRLEQATLCFIRRSRESSSVASREHVQLVLGAEREINDLRDKVNFLLDTFDLRDEDGCFTFPDGDIWRTDDDG